MKGSRYEPEKIITNKLFHLVSFTMFYQSHQVLFLSFSFVLLMMKHYARFSVLKKAYQLLIIMLD